MTYINGNMPYAVKYLPSYAEQWLHPKYTSTLLTVSRDGQPSQSRSEHKG